MTIHRTRIATGEFNRLQQLEAKRAAPKSGPQAQQEPPSTVDRDTLVNDAKLAVEDKARREALFEKFDQDGQAGLSEAEFDRLFAASAVEHADAVLADSPAAGPAARGDGIEGDSGFRRIERDVAGANEERPELDARAGEAVAANRGLEEAALAGLAPEDRQRYERISGAVAHDPRARLALQGLLLEGKLTEGPPAADGQTLLAGLDRMTAPGAVAAPLEAGTLLADTVQELFQPSGIAQAKRGTCVATSVQIQLAMENPAEYARLVGGLAHGINGATALAGGGQLVRHPGTEQDDGSERSVSSRLLQTAMMEYANGGDDYQNTEQGGGLSGGEAERLMEGLSGRDTETLHVNEQGVLHWLTSDKEVGRDEMMRRITEAANRGQPVPVGMAFAEADSPEDFRDASHKVLVTKVENDRVYYTNPWGKQESMSADEFQSRLQNANLGAVAPVDASGAASEGVSEGLAELAGLDPKSKAYRQQLDRTLQGLDEDATGLQARQDLRAIAVAYDRAGESDRAQVLRTLADSATVTKGVRRDLIRAIQDGKDTRQDLIDAMKNAGTRANPEAMDLIMAAARATRTEPGPILEAALKHRHEGDSRAIDGARLADIARHFEAAGDGERAQALRAAMGPEIKPTVREKLLDALHDDKKTEGDLKEALKQATTDAERQLIAEVATLQGVLLD